MTLLDRLRRRRDPRPPTTLAPWDAGTYVRHGIVVPRLPERDDEGAGWGQGYLDAHAEADRRTAELAAARRTRSVEQANDLEEAAHQRRLDAMRRANDEAQAEELLARTRRIVAALTPEPTPTVAPTAPVEETPDQTAEAATGEVPATDGANAYRDVPAERLTKPQARVEARRLKDAGVAVAQNGRDLPALREAITKARAALARKEIDA